ncbi:hypothetical protein [Pandoraea sputorum]|uniref:hypothetical protein n=1 Tax=Pandoraea sputorum TaxID=93222 RepID=UPI002F9176F2
MSDYLCTYLKRQGDHFPEMPESILLCSDNAALARDQVERNVAGALVIDVIRVED